MITRLLKKMSLPILLYGGLAIFLFNTDPRKLAIGWLLVPFVWLFAALFFTYVAVARYLSAWSNSKKALLLASVVAGLPTLALLLDSINQLTIRDALLLFMLGAVGLFYASKVNFRLVE